MYELPHEFPDEVKRRTPGDNLSPRHFRRWGGLGARTRKKQNKNVGPEEIRKLEESPSNARTR